MKMGRKFKWGGVANTRPEEKTRREKRGDRFLDKKTRGVWVRANLE